MSTPPAALEDEIETAVRIASEPSMTTEPPTDAKVKSAPAPVTVKLLAKIPSIETPAAAELISTPV